MSKEKIIIWCDKLIDGLLAAVIFLTPLYFAYFAENYNVFELNKLLIVRAGVSLVLGLWLVKVSLGAKLIYFNKKLWWLAAAVLAVYIFPGVVFSAKPYLSFWGSYERQQGVYSLIYYWLWFVLLLLNLRDWRQVKRLILAALSAVGLVSLYGVAQHLNLDPQRWQETGRAFSALGQPNFLGHYLIMVLPLAVGGWWLFKSKVKYYVLPLLALIQLACLLFTFSRGAWLGLALSGLVMIIVWLSVGQKKKIKLLTAAAVLAVVLGGGFWSKTFYNTNGYYRRFAASFDINNEANQARLQYWSAVGQEFSATDWRHRLFGFGKDGQADVFVRHYRRDWGLFEALNSFPDRAHNLILDVWLEFGLVGLLVLAAAGGYIALSGFRYLWRERRRKDDEYYFITALLAGIMGYWFAALFSFPLTTHYLYYYFFLALLAWLLWGGDRREIRLTQLSSAFKWTMTTVISLFIAFTFYIFTVKPFIADIWLMKAKRAEATADCSQIIYYANKMLNAFPAALKFKEHYVWLNINCLPALVDKNDVAAVAADVMADLAAYPVKEYGYHLLVNQAHAYSVFGYYLDPKYYADAEKFYLDLIKLNPELSVTYQDYARMKMWAGDDRAAQLIIEQGLAVLPVGAPRAPDYVYKKDIARQQYAFYDLLGKIKVRQKNLTGALDYFVLAQAAEPAQKMIYQQLADLSWQLGRSQAAINWLEQGKSVDPGDNVWDYNQALYYQTLGKIKEAVAAVNRALALKPDDEQVKKLLADLTAGLKPQP